MGQSKGSGYAKKDIITPQQKTFLDSLMSQSLPNQQQATQGFSQFLPGGGGGQAITEQANKNFQQQTVPSITNALGSNAKSSSYLNQALGAAGANMNTDLASLLSQLQLTAASGIGGLGSQQAQLGSQTPQFNYLQKQQPLWQSLLLGGIGGGSSVLGGWMGRPQGIKNG